MSAKSARSMTAEEAVQCLEAIGPSTSFTRIREALEVLYELVPPGRGRFDPARFDVELDDAIRSLGTAAANGSPLLRKDMESAVRDLLEAIEVPLEVPLTTAELVLPADLAGLPYDALVAAWHEVDSRSAWFKARLAATVPKGKLKQYADDVGVAYQTVKNYRAVAEKYPPESTDVGTFPFGAAEALMAQGDRLELAGRPEPWTVREARGLVAERGRTAREITAAPAPSPGSAPFPAENTAATQSPEVTHHESPPLQPVTEPVTATTAQPDPRLSEMPPDIIMAPGQDWRQLPPRPEDAWFYQAVRFPVQVTVSAPEDWIAASVLDVIASSERPRGLGQVLRRAEGSPGGEMDELKSPEELTGLGYMAAAAVTATLVTETAQPDSGPHDVCEFTYRCDCGKRDTAFDGSYEQLEALTEQKYRQQLAGLRSEVERLEDEVASLQADAKARVQAAPAGYPQPPRQAADSAHDAVGDPVPDHETPDPAPDDDFPWALDDPAPDYEASQAPVRGSRGRR